MVGFGSASIWTVGRVTASPAITDVGVGPVSVIDAGAQEVRIKKIIIIALSGGAIAP